MPIFRVAAALLVYFFSISVTFLTLMTLLAGFQSAIPFGEAVFGGVLLGLLAFSLLLGGLMIERQTIRTYSGLLKLSFGTSIVVISIWVNVPQGLPH